MKKDNFEKCQQTSKNHENLPSMQRVKKNSFMIISLEHEMLINSLEHEMLINSLEHEMLINSLEHEMLINSLEHEMSYHHKIQTNEAFFLHRTVDNIICAGHNFR